MTDTTANPDFDSDETALGEEIPAQDTGVGIGADVEPNTFEMEDDPEATNT